MAADSPRCHGSVTSLDDEGNDPVLLPRFAVGSSLCWQGGISSALPTIAVIRFYFGVAIGVGDGFRRSHPFVSACSPRSNSPILWLQFHSPARAGEWRPIGADGRQRIATGDRTSRANQLFEAAIVEHIGHVRPEMCGGYRQYG